MPTAWLEIDLEAIAGNVRRLRARVDPAQVCAVVKADAYGHGAVSVAKAVVQAGADWLAVAHVDEGETLRAAGLTVPILVLSEPDSSAMSAAVAAGLRVTVYSATGIQAASRAAVAAGATVDVHLKVDTGMGRVGADPLDALARAKEIVSASGLALEGVWTHLAVADEPENPFTAEQLDRYSMVLEELAASGIHPRLRHVANSGGVLTNPETHFDLVRVGIAIYGVAPQPGLGDRLELVAAMELKSRVSFVKRVGAGEAISYGLTHRFSRDTTVATVPIGYADGVRRQLAALGGEVLIGGYRRKIVGTITMDQLMVDCQDHPVAVGDEVVLIGHQGQEFIGVQEWAERLGTIPYEILCAIGPRVVRRCTDSR